MPKRRRCKDRLPHHEHEWGGDLDGKRNFITTPGRSNRSRTVSTTYWCPGRRKEDDQDGEAPPV